MSRARFGAGSELLIGWLKALPQPVYACYEAGLELVRQLFATATLTSA